MVHTTKLLLLNPLMVCSISFSSFSPFVEILIILTSFCHLLAEVTKKKNLRNQNINIEKLKTSKPGPAHKSIVIFI